MKMTKIYCVILCSSLILSVFAGCQSSEKKDKTSSEKQTAASVQEVSSETSTAESLTTVKENSSLNNSQTVSNNSSIVSGSGVSSSKKIPSGGGYLSLKPVYEEESYSVPKAPYDYPYTKKIGSIEEFREFITKTDPYTYQEGQFLSFIKTVQEDGYIVDPHYVGKSLFNEENFASVSIGMDYEKWYTGVGFSISFETKSGTSGTFTVYYLRDKWLESAKKTPCLYFMGKENSLFSTFEGAKANGWIEKKVKAKGKEILVHHNSNTDQFCYVYDDYMIHLYSSKNMQEFIENFSLTKIPLEE